MYFSDFDLNYNLNLFGLTIILFQINYKWNKVIDIKNSQTSDTYALFNYESVVVQK